MNTAFLSYLFNPSRKDNLIHHIDKDKIIEHYKVNGSYLSDRRKVVDEYGMLEHVFDRKFVSLAFKDAATEEFIIDLVEDEVKTNKNLRYWISNSMLYFDSYQRSLNALRRKGINIDYSAGSAADYIERNERLAVDFLTDGDWWFSDDELWDIRVGKQ